MQKLYNDVAGKDLGRLAALSDGIFAFAFTVLVIDIRRPDVSAIHSEAQLWHALISTGGQFVIVLMTFLTLGILWVAQQTGLAAFARSNRNLTWLHIGFLCAVVLMPFSTSLLATFNTYRIALLVYWFNILIPGTLLFVSYRFGRTAGLIKPEFELAPRTVELRIVIAQSLYAVGAVLCLINTYVSIAALFFIQLIYVVAPRAIPWLYRL